MIIILHILMNLTLLVVVFFMSIPLFSKNSIIRIYIDKHLVLHDFLYSKAYIYLCFSYIFFYLPFQPFFRCLTSLSGLTNDQSKLVIALMLNICVTFIPVAATFYSNYKTQRKLINKRPNMNELISTVNYKMLILGTSLYNIHTEPAYFKRQIFYLLEKTKEVDKKGKFLFIFIHLKKDSSRADVREEQEDHLPPGKSKGRIKREINKTIDTINEMINESKSDTFGHVNLIKVYHIQYDEVPQSALCLIDNNTLHYGQYYIGLHGYDTPWSVYTSKDETYSIILKVIENIITKSTQIDLYDKGLLKNIYTFKDEGKKYTEKYAKEIIDEYKKWP